MMLNSPAVYYANVRMHVERARSFSVARAFVQMCTFVCVRVPANDKRYEKFIRQKRQKSGALSGRKKRQASNWISRYEARSILCRGCVIASAKPAGPNTDLWAYLVHILDQFVAIITLYPMRHFEIEYRATLLVLITMKKRTGQGKTKDRNAKDLLPQVVCCRTHAAENGRRKPRWHTAKMKFVSFQRNSKSGVFDDSLSEVVRVNTNSVPCISAFAFLFLHFLNVVLPAYYSTVAALPVLPPNSIGYNIIISGTN